MVSEKTSPENKIFEQYLSEYLSCKVTEPNTGYVSGHRKKNECKHMKLVNFGKGS